VIQLNDPNFDPDSLWSDYKDEEEDEDDDNTSYNGKPPGILDRSRCVKDNSVEINQFKVS